MDHFSPPLPPPPSMINKCYSFNCTLVLYTEIPVVTFPVCLCFVCVLQNCWNHFILLTMHFVWFHALEITNSSMWPWTTIPNRAKAWWVKTFLYLNRSWILLWYFYYFGLGVFRLEILSIDLYLFVKETTDIMLVFIDHVDG